MQSLLSGGPVHPEEQRKNDRNDLRILFAVLGVLALYVYLFTPASRTLGLPSPQDLAGRCGLASDTVFAADGLVRSSMDIYWNGQDSAKDRLGFFLLVAAAFLSAYLLPLRLKQPSLALWSIAAVVAFYSPQVAAGLLFSQLVAYLVLHPPTGRRSALSAIPAPLALLALAPQGRFGPGQVLVSALLGVLSIPVFVFLVRPLLLRSPLAPVLKTLVVHSAVLLVYAATLVEWTTGHVWAFPLGLFLFFWHWQRLIMYHIDYKDGRVPREVPLLVYLSIFLSPGTVTNWSWTAHMGQGYAYTTGNFLCEDKNKTVLAGLRLWGIALFYAVFGRIIMAGVTGLFEGAGLPVFDARTTRLVQFVTDGGEVGTATVLMTTLLDLARWLMFWGAVAHFKAGVWRVCGYRMQPYFDRPWKATNLVNFWGRLNYHYREFLVRTFYYPVFFRVFRTRPRLRIFAATMAAACFGNLLWGHAGNLFPNSGRLDVAHEYLFVRLPYFVLLGLGISVTELYLLARKRKRKPWSLGWGLVGDLLGAYCTLQYYSLIIIFMRPGEGSTLWDLSRVFLQGFGIHLHG